MKSTSYPDFVTAKLGTLDETTRAASQQWLADLPDGTVLKPLATQVVFEHMALAGTRAKIARLQAAIGELSERPQSADNIKDRVRRCVSELGQAAQPEVHGLGVGWNEKLAVTWPHDMSMVQLVAALVPDRLVTHILAAIEADANAPLTPQEHEKLVQVRVEVEDLRYAEEKLVAAEGGTRSPDAPPWAILQARATGAGNGAAT